MRGASEGVSERGEERSRGRIGAEEGDEEGVGAGRSCGGRGSKPDNGGSTALCEQCSRPHTVPNVHDEPGEGRSPQVRR